MSRESLTWKTGTELLLEQGVSNGKRTEIELWLKQQKSRKVKLCTAIIKRGAGKESQEAKVIFLLQEKVKRSVK